MFFIIIVQRSFLKNITICEINQTKHCFSIWKVVSIELKVFFNVEFLEKLKKMHQEEQNLDLNDDQNSSININKEQSGNEQIEEGKENDINNLYIENDWLNVIVSSSAERIDDEDKILNKKDDGVVIKQSKQREKIKLSN